ncbi:uncharacterized protein F5147DRAFT_650990 [Suillus discolor]|uniref:Uncharacterized protein n=1 Tax=Suillus discolor TaxID=1912936 RepID=A0A9P7JWG0_9AGAM|nr:uncharacterized protein F5147DRAFT_650990 [Suillus discolor]KAG2112356.1 hypothetical protein F5147DRAFT_650990 [Suillus discolor]
MLSDEYWATYHAKLAELDLDAHPTSFIPRDWALNAVDIASKWVEQQFAAHVSGRPLVPAPPELDPETIFACGHLAFVLAEAYQHPIKLDIDVIQYNEALTKQESGLNDAREEALLAKFPPTERMLLDRPSVVIVTLGNVPGSPSWSGRSNMKRNKYILASGPNEHTEIASAVKPVEWGRDSAIATAVEITCAINGVGVRERMQAKAKAMAAKTFANPARRSKSRAPKSRIVNKTAINTRSRKTPIPLNRLLSEVEDSIIQQASEGELKSMDVTPAQAEAPQIPTMSSSVLIEPEGQSVVPMNHAECEPTARDILQSIQDLGRRLDCLATNDRVDVLEERLDSVEHMVGQRLDALERKLNYSDAEWKATSLSLGHLTMSLRDHMDDLTAHRSCINTTVYAPPHHGNAHLPTWLAHQEEDPNISAIGRQWTHAWDASVITGIQGHVGTSASAGYIIGTPDPAVLLANVDEDASNTFVAPDYIHFLMMIKARSTGSIPGHLARVLVIIFGGQQFQMSSGYHPGMHFPGGLILPNGAG